MKLAQDWAGDRPELTGLLRHVQADALRWAANISGVLQNVTILERADLLERLAAGSSSYADQEDERQIK